MSRDERLIPPDTLRANVSEKKPWSKPVCVRLAAEETDVTTVVGTLNDGATSLYSSVATPPTS